MAHPAQVLPEYASKACYKARDLARQQTNLFDGLGARELLRMEMILPWGTENEDRDGVRDARPAYLHRTNGPLRENSLGIL